MNFLVDKRTELMSIVLALSQGNEYIEEHFSFNIRDDYRQRVYDHFINFKHHKAIEYARKIAECDEGFNFDNPIRLAFSLNEQLEFDGKIEDYLLKELENKNLLEDFVQEVVNFSKDSEFEKFYNLNHDYYLSKIEELKKIFNLEFFIDKMQKFFKTQLNVDNFKINIIPMLVNANHGFKVANNYVANLGIVSEDFKTIEKFNNGTVHIIIHEISHNFVNCYTEGNKLHIPESFKNLLKKIGYGNAFSYLNDTIVRAITILLRSKIQNIDVQNFLNKEDSLGFVYVRKVYEELIKYEKQSKSWEEYFPKIISFLI